MKTVLLTIAMLTAYVSPGPQASYHDFHLSKCLIRYNEAEQSLQISLHIFLDDLEEALRRQGAPAPFLGTEREAESAETHLLAYLRQHFRLRVNGQGRDYEFIGKECADDLAAVWCYLEIKAVQTLQELEITNSLLLEVFDDQKNLVSIQGPGNKQGMVVLQKGAIVKKVAL